MNPADQALARGDIERVDMHWPAGLKARVCALTGERGLTGFVISAVERALLEQTLTPPSETSEVAPPTTPEPTREEQQDPPAGPATRFT